METSKIKHDHKYYHSAVHDGECTDSNVHPSDNSDMPLEIGSMADGDESNEVMELSVSIAVKASWYANWFLLFVKLVCYILSSSKSVAAALADSAVDIISQIVLYWADSYINKHSKDYPVGRSRLEALSVLGCAGLMIVASVEVVQAAGLDLFMGLTGRIPQLHNGVVVYIIMTIGVGEFFH